MAELRQARWRDWVLGRFTAHQRHSSIEKLQSESKFPAVLRFDWNTPWKGTCPGGKDPGSFLMAQHASACDGTRPSLATSPRPQYATSKVTDDLASFWATGYAMVKKDLKRRYPKHSWPDDTLTASPSKR